MVDQRNQRGKEIREFIVRNMDEHPRDIARFTSEHFRITRQAVLRHVRKLSERGIVTVAGRTRDRQYALAPIRESIFELPIAKEVQEDAVWRQRVRPVLEGIRGNVIDICQHGFTEIFNNALEHSAGVTVLTSVKYFPNKIRIMIRDDGIGIFQKIQAELHLDDRRHAVLELSKGKLTTDPKGHTGEGIFFTSRMFDEFRILSGDLFFSHTEPEDDWLIEGDKERNEGTVVFLTIDPDSERTRLQVFDKHSFTGSYGFDRTHVPVALSRYGDENLLSRSQARRLLARFERFKEVFLDFKGVATVGQAFADEIFRVFLAENPQVKIVYVNASREIKRMIWRAKGLGTE